MRIELRYIYFFFLHLFSDRSNKKYVLVFSSIQAMVFVSALQKFLYVKKY